MIKDFLFWNRGEPKKTRPCDSESNQILAEWLSASKSSAGRTDGVAKKLWLPASKYDLLAHNVLVSYRILWQVNFGIWQPPFCWKHGEKEDQGTY